MESMWILNVHRIEQRTTGKPQRHAIGDQFAVGHNCVRQKPLIRYDN
jgi:hypothetical protein